MTEISGQFQISGQLCNFSNFRTAETPALYQPLWTWNEPQSISLSPLPLSFPVICRSWPPWPFIYIIRSYLC